MTEEIPGESVLPTGCEVLLSKVAEPSLSSRVACAVEKVAPERRGEVVWLMCELPVKPCVMFGLG
jgi:hypothetical protein